MPESVIKPFTSFTYKTKDGNTITATKNNDIVTLVDNKGETRQLGLEEFKKEFINNSQKLEKTPSSDVFDLNSSENKTTEKTYKKPDIGATIGGSLIGSIVANITKFPSKLVSPSILKKLNQLSEGLSSEQIASIENAANSAIKSTGLKEKGVEIIRATMENADEIDKIMEKEINEGIFKFMPKGVRGLISKVYSAAMMSGENACYAFASKKVVLPDKKLKLSAFHEIGHAMNDNLSKIGKILQKSRNLSVLALPIALIAMFTTKKAEDEKPEGKLDSATTFIKNNAGKLTFLTFLPTLLEEGLATIKGNKIAKEMLSSELAKKVAKNNAIAYTSYLLLSILSGLGIYLGVKVKDAIAKPKEIENK